MTLRNSIPQYSNQVEAIIRFNARRMFWTKESLYYISVDDVVASSRFELFDSSEEIPSFLKSIDTLRGNE